MGREVKRVPMDFNWPMKERWFGYVLPPVFCQLCDGTGKNGTAYCHCCEGEGKVWPKVEIPAGDGWQMWETCSEGSPISPVFTTPEELAHWLADNKASAFGDMTATYEEWLGMIGAGYSAGSMVIDCGVMKSGVAAMAEHKAKMATRRDGREEGVSDGD
jgi:hypothetical protein